MAINPETRYVGKINPSDADYPFGSARNITIPGDGTGTPFDAPLVNDVFGFQQALLDQAGIVPSGNPDKVGASQYIDALDSRYTRRMLASQMNAAIDLDIDAVVFVTDLFGGTYWRVTNGEIVPGHPSSVMTFDDEIAVEQTNGNFLFLDVDLNKSLLQDRNRAASELYFAKIAEDNTTVDIKSYGDSIVFGQATAAAPGAVDKIGVATGFGDGSVHAQWQFTNNWPQVLEDKLNTVYRGALTVFNGGFSGDRAMDGYLRHRALQTAGISTVSYGINDSLATTNNGLDNTTLTDTARQFSVPNFTGVLRRFIAREILRGNGVVVFGTTNFLSANGWNGTSADSSILCEAWNMAAKKVADELGVMFVDMRKDIVNQYQLQRINEDGTHPLPLLGHEIIGTRTSSLFVGQGFRRPVTVGTGAKLLANPTVNNVASKDYTVASSAKSPTPPFNGNAQSTILAVTDIPVSFSFFLDSDDVLCIPTFVCANGTVTVDLDYQAEQQEYKMDFSVYRDKAVNPVSGAAIANPVSTIVMDAPQGQEIVFSRRSVIADSSAPKYLHVSGSGWHTVTLTVASNGAAPPVCHIGGFEFLTWEDLRKGTEPAFELIVDTVDLSIAAAASSDIYTTTRGNTAEELFIRIGWEVIPGNSPRYSQYKAIYQGGNIVFSGISASEYGIDFATTYTLVWIDAGGGEGTLRLTAGGGAGGEVDIQIYRLNTVYPSIA